MKTFSRIIALAVLLGISSPALAQTYVRPSKGAVLTVANIPQNTAMVTSPTYDWTSFMAVAQTFKWSKADGTACACPAGHQCSFSFRAKLMGSTVKTGPFFEIQGIAAEVPIFGDTAQDGFQGGALNVDVPYIQVKAETDLFKDVTTSTPIATPCYMNIAATPTPFTYRSTVEGPSPNRSVIGGNYSPVLMGGSGYNFDNNQNITRRP